MAERDSASAEVERIEFIGGPWADRQADMPGLPDHVARQDGRYVRSVRCADDGAMRYVWRPSPALALEGDRSWPTGS